MTNSPIIDRKKVLEGHAFNVEKVRFELPDGRQRDYDLVDHADAVTILPIDESGFVYFVRQYRIGAEKELLELPAGVMDEGEDPLSSAHRELREEIGKDALSMERVGGFYMAAGYSSEYMHIYLARGLTDAPLQQDDDEFLSLEKVEVKGALEMIKNGQIEDGKTISAFMLAFEELRLYLSD